MLHRSSTCSWELQCKHVQVGRLAPTAAQPIPAQQSRVGPNRCPTAPPAGTRVLVVLTHLNGCSDLRGLRCLLRRQPRHCILLVLSNSFLVLPLVSSTVLRSRGWE